MTIGAKIRNPAISALAVLLATTAVVQSGLAGEPDPFDEPGQQVAQRRSGGAGAVRPGRSGIELSLYGQVDRALLRVNDGRGSDMFFVDNANSSTRLGVRASGTVSRALTIGSAIEFEIVSNASDDITMPNRGGLGGADFNDRRLEVFVRHGRYGTLWLGEGHTASNTVAEVDLTRTDVVTSSDIQDVAGSVRFNRGGPRIRDVYTNMDGLGRDDRVRYDTPLFSGFRASVSYVDGGAYDLALRYRGRIDRSLTLAASVALSDESAIRSDDREQFVGSVSIRHRDGWSAAFAIGAQTINSSRDPSFLYGKLAYEIPGLFGIGRTVLAADIAYAEQVASAGDAFLSYGAYVVQVIDRAGADAYIGIRNHRLDRSSGSFDDILTMVAGVRLKF